MGRRKAAEDEQMRLRQSGQTVMDAENTVSYNSFFNLLVVVPESKDCYETVAIFNYFGFPYCVE